MKIRNPVHIILLVTTVVLSGCQGYGGSNEQSGVVVGAVLGGLLGNQVGRGSGRTAAIIVGTLVGSQIGGDIGRTMDDTDRLKVAHSLETIRTGVPTTWRNPDTSYEYSVLPTRTFQSSGRPCREYTIDAIIGGRKEQVFGTACRQPDGSWRTLG